MVSAVHWSGQLPIKKDERIDRMGGANPVPMESLVVSSGAAKGEQQQQLEDT